MKYIKEGLKDGRWITGGRIRIYSLMLLAAYILALGIWFHLATGLRDRAGHPVGTDFLNVYAAGLMTDRGHSAQVYDWNQHQIAEREVAGFEADYYGWHYPPMFLGLAAALALLPYLWALCLYLGTGFCAYLLVIRRIVPKFPQALWLAAAFPGVFINTGNGQNGFLTTALLGAGLHYLGISPWASGLLFGLLAYKPQFFILIPFVLLAGGYYRAFFSTLLTAAATATLSYLLLGQATWLAFFASLRLTRSVILEQGATGWEKIQSLFSLVRMLGGSTRLAYALHAMLAVAALAILAILWRQRVVSLAQKSAALVAATLLFTPYVLDYDLTLLALPVAFLAGEGLESGFRPYEKSLLAALWILPFIARLTGQFGFILTPFLLVALLGMCLVRKRLSVLT